MTNEPYQFAHPATGCAHCPNLAPQRHSVVWGSGPTPASIMLIGEAPGYNEDMQGLPFIGQAGSELTKRLRAAEIARPDVHIANRIMCRPPGNRDPSSEELDNCLPWLVQHVREVQPDALVLFGRSAIGWLFDRYMVKDTRGLMYIWMCDHCGAHSGDKNGAHAERFAFNGYFYYPPIAGVDELAAIAYARKEAGPCKMVRRLVAAIYHPANVLHGDQAHRDDIDHQLKRVKTELATAGGTP